MAFLVSPITFIYIFIHYIPLSEPISCVDVEPFGSAISYKFEDVAIPKASVAVASNGVSPPARSVSSPDAVGKTNNVEFVNPKSVVKATVPELSGKVIVLSAVGSVTVSVVSKVSSVAPSKVILEPRTSILVGDIAAIDNVPVISKLPMDAVEAARDEKLILPDSNDATSVTRLLN